MQQPSQLRACVRDSVPSAHVDGACPRAAVTMRSRRQQWFGPLLSSHGMTTNENNGEYKNIRNRAGWRSRGGKIEVQAKDAPAMPAPPSSTPPRSSLVTRAPSLAAPRAPDTRSPCQPSQFEPARPCRRTFCRAPSLSPSPPPLLLQLRCPLWQPLRRRSAAPSEPPERVAGR